MCDWCTEGPRWKRGAMAAPLQRALYPTLAQCRYLNQASLGLVSEPAVDAMRAFLDDIARHGNLHMTDDEEVAFASALRSRAARMLHAEPDRVALVGGASELMGQLPGMLEPQRGSAILCVASDFPAVTRPWLRYAEARDCCVRFIEDDPAVDLTEALVDAVDDTGRGVRQPQRGVRGRELLPAAADADVVAGQPERALEPHREPQRRLARHDRRRQPDAPGSGAPELCRLHR